MSVTRTWVFPIIRLLIFAAIAAALVKFAFFPDPMTEPITQELPTGSVVEPEVAAMVGTVRNDVVLDGTVNADAAVPIRATLAGEVRKTMVSAGQRVDAGSDILQIRGVNEDGTPRWVTVKAPVAGTVSSFDILVGQTMTVGETVGQVAPPTFNVTAALAPEQQYRLTTQPTDAVITVTGGPAPFTCTGLTITTPLAGANSAPGGGGTDPSTPDTAPSTTTVRCAIPAEVRVFAGLTGKVTLAGGVAENVLVIPTTAVEGGGGSGIVYLTADGSEAEKREVTLGLSDGTTVEVVSGLAQGDTVLQFVPGARTDTGAGDGPATSGAGG